MKQYFKSAFLSKMNCHPFLSITHDLFSIFLLGARTEMLFIFSHALIYMR